MLPSLVDIRVALRTLRRSPLVSVAAVLTLAVGIGPTVAMATLVYSALVQPLPYPEPERLVMVGVEDLTTGELMPPSAGAVGDGVASMSSFDRVVRVSAAGALMVGGREPAVVFGSGVEAPFFEVFGVPVARGRWPTRAGEAMIATRLWERQFGGRDDVIGRSLKYRDQALTIVGVVGSRYDFPFRSQVWFVPTAWQGPVDEPDWEMAIRLAPGVTIETARTELAAVATRLERDQPRVLRGQRLFLQLLHEVETGYLRSPLLTLSAAAALVVLIACANVANLLLAAGTGRRREMALRRAIGATPWSLARGVLVESSLLAAVGVGCGVLLAAWAVPLILTLAPAAITRQTTFSMSWPVLASAAMLGAAVTIAFGVAPALSLARVPAMDPLNQTTPTASLAQSRVMAGLVGAQAAIGIVLVVGTALLASSLMRMMEAVEALPADRLAALRVDLTQTPKSALRLRDAVTAFVEERGGAVVASSGLPLETPPSAAVMLPRAAEAASTPLRAVSPGYFATLGQRVVSGRDFSSRDRAGQPLVAIVSETLARRLAAAGDDPLGAALQMHPSSTGRQARTVVVVGVAADVRASLTSRPRAELYLPLAQAPEAADTWLSIFAPAAGAEAVASALRRVVGAIDAETPVEAPIRLDQLFRERTRLPRFRAALMTSFGVLALALAAAGVFAMTLYVVARRSREFAVRIAVGASPRDLVRAVVPTVAVPLGLGVAVGLAAATQLAPLLRGMLFYEVSATAPAVYAAAAAVFIATSLAASLVPLRRVWDVDPVEMLRRD